MRKLSTIGLLLAVLMVLLAACGGNGSDISENDVILTQAAQIAFDSLTGTAEAMPTATDTPLPTDTPEPTATPTTAEEIPTNALSEDLTATALAGGDTATSDGNATATLPPFFTATPSGDSGSSNNNNGGSCTYAAAFEGVETIPDGTTYPWGKNFTKTWRVKNTGTCTWDSQVELRWYQTLFDGKEETNLLSGGSVTKVIEESSVAPNEYLNIAIDLIVPNGKQGIWHLDYYLSSPKGLIPLNGNPGGLIWLEIKAISNE